MLFSIDSGVPVLPSDEIVTDRADTVCFTGHRENSVLPYRGDPIYSSITLRTVQLMLFRYIDMAVESGYRSFISGLAEGTDLWAAKYILGKKHSDSSIRLIGVMPYLRHAERFSPRYKELLCDAERGADMLLTTNTDPDVVYGKSRSEGECLSRPLQGEELLHGGQCLGGDLLLQRRLIQVGHQPDAELCSTSGVEDTSFRA